MNPEDLLEWFTSAAHSIRLAPHAEFLEREAAYWRDEAIRLRNELATVHRTAGDGINKAVCPPEPPVGTQFHHATTGQRMFFRGDLGWYCGKEDCRNCPCSWPEAAERLSPTDRRTLPGMTTTRDTSETP